MKKVIYSLFLAAIISNGNVGAVVIEKTPTVNLQQSASTIEEKIENLGTVISTISAVVIIGAGVAYYQYANHLIKLNLDSWLLSQLPVLNPLFTETQRFENFNEYFEGFCEDHK